MSEIIFEVREDQLGSRFTASAAGQTFEVTLIGGYVTVIQNGQTVISNQEIPGITGGTLDSHEELPGPIYL
jgi:hypothetical protein